MPPASAAPYPRSATSTTRAPAAAATAREPSSEPLSATSTSPAIPARSRKPRALAMQLPTVGASLRQGMSIVNSVIERPSHPPKKKVPRRVPFTEAKLRLLAAAGTGQVLERNVGARAAAGPAVQSRAVACREYGRGRGRRHRDQRDHRRIHRSGDALHRGRHSAVKAGADARYVLRSLRGANFTAPAIYGRRNCGARLVHLGDRGTARAHAENDLGHLGADRVVLVRR